MTARKRIPAVAVKRFYTPTELSELTAVKRDVLIRNALLFGVLYRINCKKLINYAKLIELTGKGSTISELMSGKYCNVTDAAIFLGLDEDLVLQIASDAGALLRYREVVLVNKKEMESYIEKFHYKANLFDMDEIEEQAKIERRRKYYV